MSFTQSATIELEIKESPGQKPGLFPLITRNFNEWNILAVTHLE
jgi:hypothetical protein